MSDIESFLPKSMNSSDVQLMAIEFSEDYEVLEITYVERRNVTDKAHKIERAVFTAELLPVDEYADVIDSLQDFLDLGLREITNSR